MNQFDSVPIYQTRFDRVLGVTMTFALIGPPLGLVMLVASSWILSALKSQSTVTLGGLFRLLINLLPAIPYAYFLGAIPATIAGLLVGICKEWIGRAAWWIAMMVGVMVGIGFVWFMEPPPSFRIPSAAVDWSMRIRLLLTNIVPTMLCWWVVRNWYVRGAQS